MQTVQELIIDGETIHFYAEPTSGRQNLNASSSAPDPGTERDIAADMRNKLRAVVGQVKAAMDATAPKEWEVEIGMQLESKLGVVFASGTTTGTIKLKAKWVRT